MDYGVGAGGGRCGSAVLQWESIRKREWASAETTQILPVRGAAVQLFAGDRGELPIPVCHLPADAGTGAGIPSRFVCKLFAGSGGMKSAGNGDVVQSRLQVLHVHVFLVAPLDTRYCTIFSDIVCSLLSNVCVVTSFCQSLQAMSSFMHFPICATYCTLSGQNIRLNQHKGIYRPVYG